MEEQTKKSGKAKGKSTNSDQIQIRQLNAAMINHAKGIAEEIGAAAVLAYVDLLHSRELMEAMFKECRCILAARTEEVIHELIEMSGSSDRILRVPYMNMTRTSQIKVAAILALSKGLIQRDQRIVCLSGSPGGGVYDSLTVLNVSREFEIFSSSAIDIAAQLDNPHIFDRLLTIVLELAQEGKEGKPLGTAFILGDHKKVMDMSSQMAINPFAKVPEDTRNIMDPALKETLREFSPMDGAFVVRDDGVVLAAARHLNVSAEIDKLPQGLGARHRSAAGITSVTNAIAFVISESTGMVRIFSQGRIFMEIEKHG
jgi:diadenylate cyclase